MLNVTYAPLPRSRKGQGELAAVPNRIQAGATAHVRPNPWRLSSHMSVLKLNALRQAESRVWGKHRERAVILLRRCTAVNSPRSFRLHIFLASLLVWGIRLWHDPRLPLLVWVHDVVIDTLHHLRYKAGNLSIGCLDPPHILLTTWPPWRVLWKTCIAR